MTSAAILKEIRIEAPLAEVEVETEVDGEEAKNKSFKVGDEIKVDAFTEGDTVRVTGTSKGKGFAGVIKRHNFSRGPMSHGSHHHRKPGSIGSAYPQHVFRGTKLPGRMGGVKVTTKGLKVMSIDVETNMIAIKGSIPGPNKSLVFIKG